VFDKQLLDADQRAPGRLSRRTLVLGAAGVIALREQSWGRRAAGCGGSPAATLAPKAESGTTAIANVAGYRQLKDPCVVWDGSAWHRYGTGWMLGAAAPIVFHARADSATGAFTMGARITLDGVSGGGVAAPGVVVDDGVFHMFVQTEFRALGGGIEHLVSTDGDSFVRTDTAITADVSLGEATVYDAQPCVIGGQRYLAYAAEPTVSHSELHLARSTGPWSGPWVRLGAIVRQSDVVFQNRVGCPGYEWGLEGPQLVELPSGQVLLMGVCFVGGLDKGRRQRVFVAIASALEGPYDVLGTPFDPRFDVWATGENGHPGAALVGDSVVVVYQRRQGAGAPWSLGTATIRLDSLRR
jgi:hypothetical protein